MYIEGIIAEKRRLIGQGIAPETMLLKLKRPVAEWLTIEGIANWDRDLPILGIKAEVDESLKADFSFTLLKNESNVGLKGQPENKQKGKR